MEVDVYANVSDEEYLVLRAKDALKKDAMAAKAWMITAKTLYPNNFGVQVKSFSKFVTYFYYIVSLLFQFEAYQIEKEARNFKEAAKCFSDL